MGITEIFVGLVKIALIFVRHKNDPDIAYQEALNELSRGYKRKTNGMASASQSGDAARVRALLSELRRKRMLSDLPATEHEDRNNEDSEG